LGENILKNNLIGDILLSPEFAMIYKKRRKFLCIMKNVKQKMENVKQIFD
jgi:hypothetical protein